MSSMEGGAGGGVVDGVRPAFLAASRRSRRARARWAEGASSLRSKVGGASMQRHFAEGAAAVDGTGFDFLGAWSLSQGRVRGIEAGAIFIAWKRMIEKRELGEVVTNWHEVTRGMWGYIRSLNTEVTSHPTHPKICFLCLVWIHRKPASGNGGKRGFRSSDTVVQARLLAQSR